MTDGIVRYVLTDHARYEIARRGLGDELVGDILRKPDQRIVIRRGREVFQARRTMGDQPKEYLIRVIVDVDREPAEVVTAYRTTRISKYWRPNR